jgi:hypothetical protein
MSHNSLAVCGTAIWLLCLCSVAEASIDGGDETGDGPSVWQYIVIALALAFVFMTGKIVKCLVLMLGHLYIIDSKV